jgi:hypothetical protein
VDLRVGRPGWIVHDIRDPPWIWIGRSYARLPGQHDVTGEVLLADEAVAQSALEQTRKRVFLGNQLSLILDELLKTAKKYCSSDLPESRHLSCTNLKDASRRVGAWLV